MRKQVLGGLFALFCGLILGGLYILSSMSSITTKIDSLLLFQQVEHLRDTLTHEIQVTLTTLQRARDGALTSTESDLFDDIAVIDDLVSQCVSCHRNDERFDILVAQSEAYLTSLSRTRTLHANPIRVAEIREQAYERGSSLLETFSQLSEASSNRLNLRTVEVNDAIKQTRQVVAGLIIIGPFTLLIAVLVFLRRVNMSVATLVGAARQLGRGNLKYRINSPLKNEFLVVAEAFNSMAEAISEEKKNTASMQRLYQSLFESAQDAICILDTEPTRAGVIISANKAAGDLYGYTLEELKKMRCPDLSPEISHVHFSNRINRVLQGESIHEITTRQRKDGSTFTAEIVAGPMSIDNRNYVLTFTRDITEREQAKSELLRANQISVVGQMAVGLAHEIKNPLAGIKATIEVLAADLDLPKDDQNLLLQVNSEIVRMERLLKNLLRFARPPQPHLEATSLHQLIEHTIRNIEITVAKTTTKRIRFIKDLCVESPKIEIDPEQLQQVFLNLYLNAVDAIAGTGTVSTRSQLDTKNHQVIIDISDNGAGMLPSTQENLFKPFFTTKSKGTGLGLAICLRLIEQHKGKLLVKSEPDKGTTFTIILPTHHNLEGNEHHG